MALSRDDQNTFLMIGGVLIVCIIALIAVASSIWALIRDPVNAVINTVSSFVRIQTLDYNFPLPVVTAQTTPTSTPSPAPNPVPNPPANNATSNTTPSNINKDIDYNFPVENIALSGLEDAIISDSKLLELSAKNVPVTQPNISIQILSIGVNSPVLQGLDSENLLKQGFWIVPSSRILGKAEIIFLCNRRYFGSDDPKSCWFLDKVILGNDVTLKYNNLVLKYKVVGVNRFPASDPLVYDANETEDLIRIVTTDPLYSNDQRLVILAERVK
ncbi:MAG: sortase [Candidatus Dojkabacteria bacterium]